VPMVNKTIRLLHTFKSFTLTAICNKPLLFDDEGIYDIVKSTLTFIIQELW